MRTIKITASMLLIATGLAFGQTATKPADAPKPRVLLITGRDVPAHNWRETTPVLREHLEKNDAFEVMVCEEPLILESATALKTYDVILMNYYNWQKPPITELARGNLLEFARGGKGLVCFHFSTRAWVGAWSEYPDLVGRVWITGSGHGPRGPFKVKVTDKNHPITEGIGDFEADDELYAKLEGSTPIHVLAEAYSDWSKRTEPMAWTLNYGKGRVFTVVLGHDAKACRNPDFARLLVQGTKWTLATPSKE